jgi:hypothetical protein
VQVLYNFGREDANNRAALQRLVASVTRFLDPDQALAAAGEGLTLLAKSAGVVLSGCRQAVGSAQGVDAGGASFGGGVGVEVGTEA